MLEFKRGKLICGFTSPNREEKVMPTKWASGFNKCINKLDFCKVLLTHNPKTCSTIRDQRVVLFLYNNYLLLYLNNDQR